MPKKSLEKLIPPSSQQSSAESNPDTKVTGQKVMWDIQEHCVLSEHFTCEINTQALQYLIVRGGLSKNK